MAGPPNEVAPNLREDRNNMEREGGWERLIIIKYISHFYAFICPKNISIYRSYFHWIFWEIFHI